MTRTVSYQPGFTEAWHEPQDRQPADPLLRNWLLDTGSLTERLQAHCRQFAVEVLRQEVAALSDDEQQFLFARFNKLPQPVQVREVFLQCEQRNWVFARSLLPCALIENEIVELGRLGGQPLGKIIFNDIRFQRQEFQLVQCEPNSETLQRLNIEASHSCWGRRSLFRFKHYHIMVAELFLPGSPAYGNYNL